MPEDRKQIRVRLPVSLLQELEAAGGTVQDQIVNQLRLASLSRRTLLEHTMARAVALCFVSAETVTGKSLDSDKETLKLALDMSIKMVSYFDELVKGPNKPRRDNETARKTVEALLKVAFLDDERRQSVLTGLAAAT